MYGQPHNSTSLEGCQPDPKVASQKLSQFLAVLDIIMIPLSGANLLRVVSRVYALPVHSGPYCILFFVFTFTAL
jgi:hypothetical protein